MTPKTEHIKFNPDRDFTLDELIGFFLEEFHASGEECIKGTQTKDIVHSLKAIRSSFVNVSSEERLRASERERWKKECECLKCEVLEEMREEARVLERERCVAVILKRIGHLKELQKGWSVCYKTRKTRIEELYFMALELSEDSPSSEDLCDKRKEVRGEEK
jgi:hypothetical protein